jgi:hypothetical protein
MVEASRVQVHPASHSCPIDSRDSSPSSGTRWTFRAARGRDGMSSSASCVEYMMAPLGLRIWIGGLAFLLLITGADREKKFDVVPVSPIALGGPLFKVF